MEVQVLRKTERPERLVCQAGRGDYYEDYIGDTAYSELMEGVDYPDEYVEEAIADTGPSAMVTEARTRAFIETQLGREHYGLWEHPHITFTVKGVSRVTMAQITRHRHMSFDIQSMRYADFSEQEIVVPATLLSDENRHERYPHIYDENGKHFNRDEGHFDMDEQRRAHWRNAYVAIREEIRDFYQGMVEAGIPKEDARFILPLGTSVNMTFTGNARTFLHLLNLRASGAAQWEIRELAEALLDELFEWCPHTFEWYANNKPHHIGP